MPRSARIVISDHPHHIIQRGQVVFVSDDDYQYYLDNQNLVLLMKRIAGRQTRHVNRLENRSGTLWEGRYKSSPICVNEYLLACSRYVELNPVRAGIVTQAEAYRWSSYGAKVGAAKHEWLDFDPQYLGLASTERKRQGKYRDFVQGTIPERELEQIRRGIQRGQLTGSRRFMKAIEAKVGRRIEFRGPGRPSKTKK